MSELKTVLEQADRVASRFTDDAAAFDRLQRRRAARVRNARVRVIAVALVIASISALTGYQLVRTDRGRPISGDRTPTGPFATARGWIAIGGSTIRAINPTDPTRSVVLSTKGGEPLAWSSDGMSLLVARDVPAANGRVVRSSLFVVHSDGSETLVARDGSGGSFTPDGSAVVYGDFLSIDEVPVTGGPPQPIANGERSGVGYLLPYFRGGQLSPDGETLAYIHVTNRHVDESVWLMNIDGTGGHGLVGPSDLRADDRTIGAVREVYPLAWSPDGDVLLFSATVSDLQSGGSSCETFSIGADGSDLRRLLPAPHDRPSCWLAASWSPAGDRIAVMDRARGLYSIAPDGSDARRIESAPAQNTIGVAWNPGG
jgi:hypothetical protein